MHVFTFNTGEVRNGACSHENIKKGGEGNHTAQDLNLHGQISQHAFKHNGYTEGDTKRSSPLLLLYVCTYLYSHHLLSCK